VIQLSSTGRLNSSPNPDVFPSTAIIGQQCLGLFQPPK
jgi:hypothetical protein